ncbi:hypothetical protein BGAL_0211g00220 [Botrytis galanthina]|uniref:Uncharacterized protein n=1 Tax=Botrytis galanthina TaxID=278940 RepID=A0A4S8QUY9_9HELO|nr:hypothetical protein BGAL_0211g00220 [Botrytis galanthina]
MIDVSKRRFYGVTGVDEKHPVLTATMEEFKEYFKFLVAVEVIIKANDGNYPDELDERAGPEHDCADKSMPELEKLALVLSPEDTLALKDAPNSDSYDDVMPALERESEEDVMPDLEGENGNIVRRGSAERNKNREKALWYEP